MFTGFIFPALFPITARQCPFLPIFFKTICTRLQSIFLIIYFCFWFLVLRIKPSLLTLLHTQKLYHWVTFPYPIQFPRTSSNAILLYCFLRRKGIPNHMKWQVFVFFFSSSSLRILFIFYQHYQILILKDKDIANFQKNTLQ